MEFLSLMTKFYGLSGSVYAICTISKEVVKFCLKPVEEVKIIDSHLAELA